MTRRLEFIKVCLRKKINSSDVHVNAHGVIIRSTQRLNYLFLLLFFTARGLDIIEGRL